MKEGNDIFNIKRGYLTRDFEIFHLKDQKDLKLEAHYHDFNKIIVFISGNVTYLIEGKAYKLKPWDILLVSSNEIHKPLIDSSEIYERIIIWVNPIFLKKHSNAESNLLTCFEIASKEKHNLIRLSSEFIITVKSILFRLKDASSSMEFGSHILRNALLIQLIVYLNRLFMGVQDSKEQSDIEYDENISDVLNYINENLGKDLTIDKLSSNFYLSKYYLMHKFKNQTGYTVHNYILQKRLIMSNTLIKKGYSVNEACIECGFGDYSNFIRSFKKKFGLPPKKYYKALKEFESLYNDKQHE